MMRSLLALRGFLLGHRLLLAVALLIMGGAAWLNSQTVKMITTVFRPLFHGFNASLMPTLYANAEKFLIVALGAAVTNGLGMYLGDLVGQRILIKLRQAVFNHLQTLSVSFFEHRRAGELISRVNNDTVILQRALGTDLSKMVVGPLTAVCMIGWMIHICWQLTVAISLTVPLVFFATSFMGRFTRRYALRTQQRIADLTANTQENFSAIRIVKTFGLEPLAQRRYGEAALGVFKAEMKNALMKAISYPVVFGLISLATALTLVIGGYELLIPNHVVDGSAGIVSFLILLQATGAQLNSVARQYLTMQQADAAAQRTLDLLAEKATVDDTPDAIEMDTVTGRVTFEDVAFSYDGVHDVLIDLNLDIQPGEVVALAGPSGAGKTTIANLVPRLYDVRGGRVLIDGVDVRQVKQASLKRFMGMVPQETILFGTTIHENIGFGRAEATFDEIVEAAKAANAHDFIMALPEGYETQVGERGVLLSGGQRQRIAIARAFLRDPRILILDEATSALDTESEKAVHSALKTLLQGRTALIIAHRLSTIRDADRIVVMAEGHIFEQGTHEELLERNGLYRRLYESREFIADESPQPSAT